MSNGNNSAAEITGNEIFFNRFPRSGSKDMVAPGIGVREKARPVIYNNLLYRNGAGIGVLNMDSNAEPLKISGNKIFENYMGGINIRGGDGPTIDNRVSVEFNEIFRNMAVGIRSIKLSEVVIRFNEIYENRKAGISLWDVKKAKVEHNEIHGNFTSGIRLLDVPDVYVRKNHIYGNITTGIDFINWKLN
ncbi:MAG: hypothetical protein DSZ23_00880 [Thermodesulfatator sp.]|nr:MAG: hypothetical protein DSZ23_00880 [Thermodesulfatator sp.]